MKDHQWIDITTPIAQGMVHWPGDEPVVLSRAATIGENDSDANVTTLSLSAHTGTHIDAPLHFLADGEDITSLPLDSLIGRTRVIHITDTQQITFSELKEFNIN